MYDIATGRTSLDPEITQLLKEPLPRQVTALTTREREVLRLVVQGQHNSEICKHLHVSIKTVEAHLTSVYQKLGVQLRAEAVACAKEQGLLLETESTY